MPLALPLLLALPALQAPAPTTGAEAILEAARAKEKAVLKARTDFMRAGGNTKDFHGDCAKELADLDARLAAETRPDVRQALLVSRLFHLMLAKQAPAPAFLEQVKREVPPAAPAWSLDPTLMSDQADADPAGWDAYVAQARATHPDPAVRRSLLLAHFWSRLDAKDEAAWKADYDALQKDHAGSREARQATAILEGDRKTGIGRPAPLFSLPALGDPATVYTPASFKGKYVLIDFWATWCPSCRVELPGLHKAWARFKDRNFEILSLSFDRRIEHIASFRQQPATPMPWKHAYVEGGFASPVGQAYGVNGIPKAVLVSPEGVIVANGAQLMGENLEKTLATFLGN